MLDFAFLVWVLSLPAVSRVLRCDGLCKVFATVQTRSLVDDTCRACCGEYAHPVKVTARALMMSSFKQIRPF
jgi:hypothetical protein